MEVVMLGFASWKDGSFELIVRNPKTHRETTLEGKLKDKQLAEVADILPSCVYVQAEGACSDDVALFMSTLGNGFNPAERIADGREQWKELVKLMKKGKR